MFRFFVLLALLIATKAFIPRSPVTRLSPVYANKMTSSEDGYDAVGSLIRFGPVPFFIRLAKSETYEAAIIKYQNQEKCSRTEAMGNMDAYFSDPNGWAAQKLREKKGTAPKIDYANLNTSPANLLLTGIWAIGIVGLGVRIYQVQSSLPP